MNASLKGFLTNRKLIDPVFSECAESHLSETLSMFDEILPQSLLQAVKRLDKHFTE